MAPTPRSPLCLYYIMLRWHVTWNFILFIYELGGKAQLLTPNA
ncbi:hypothetical protein ACMD2_05096 [Ananas comosus]|uniref:Uncharacterized protein n=1 Tax=Ananas comosus TaxID=4615 RepID=A0A199UKZ9_ANACO|nr:hypothetical protein ACMD2_05096 [Ananas comosus]